MWLCEREKIRIGDKKDFELLDERKKCCFLQIWHIGLDYWVDNTDLTQMVSNIQNVNNFNV